MNEKDEDDEWDRKKRRDPFEGLFNFTDIEKEFERMQKLTDELIRRSVGRGENVEQRDPFVYGFSLHTGPDGSPEIREFGNMKDSFSGKSESEWTPLTDVQETDDSILVTMDVPGVEKENINVEVRDHELVLDVSGSRKYSTTVELPMSVKSSESSATYNNGVLEIKLPKEEEEKKGEPIKID